MNRLLFILPLILALLASSTVEAKKKKYPNGDYYEGEWKKGQPHGTGKMVYANGDMYEGNWLFGKIEGEGQMTYKNGRRYIGSWRNGKPNGNGTMTFNNGSLYEGKWTDGEIIEGKCTDKQKNVFEGTFENGFRFKRGRLNFVNGDYNDGEWVNNKFANGTCKLTTKSFQYEGEIKDGEYLTGKFKGKIKDNYFDGTWYNGEFVGHCIIYNCNNQIRKFEGNSFADGNYNGIIEYKNNAIYTGALNGNLNKNGKGTLKEDSLTMDGVWQNDTLLYGNGNFKRNGIVYNLKIEGNKVSNQIITISSGEKILVSKPISADAINGNLTAMFTDIIILAEREKGKEIYKKYLEGKYFFLKIPLTKYFSDVFKIPIAGAELKRMIDKNMVMIIGIAPISENKLLFIQYPKIEKEIESYNRGYLIQQSGFMRKMYEIGLYNYTLKDGYLRFKSEADFSSGNYQINDNNKLFNVDYKILLSFYSLNQFNELLVNSIKKDLDAIKKEAKDHSVSENYYMTNEELREKYKTSLPNREPSFPGGKMAMNRFINSNLQYPRICQENGIQGTVVLQFTVTRDGELKDIKVVKDIDPYLKKEAIRVVKLMPKWEPAVSDRQFIDKTYTVPFSFKLN